MKGGLMEYLSTGYFMRYHQGSDLQQFITMENQIKEAPWGDTWKIRIMEQEETLEVREDLLTPTNRPSQLPKNLK